MCENCKYKFIFLDTEKLIDVIDLMFSQCCCWGFRFCGIWLCDYFRMVGSIHSVTQPHIREELNPVDMLQNTALHLATMDNKPNAVALLLSMNCKLLYNCHDMSAIDYAIYYKFPEAALAMVTHEERWVLTVCDPKSSASYFFFPPLPPPTDTCQLNPKS